MEVVKLIQPHEFGDNFILEDGKWKVKFPPVDTSGVKVSTDANNLVTLGVDGGMFVDATRLHAWALVQDNANMKIHLYRHQAGTEFVIAQATLISSIDMLELNGQFDDITITDAIVTFKDVQTDTELVFDTDQFQNRSDLVFQNPLTTNQATNATETSPESSLVVLVPESHNSSANLITKTPDGLLMLPPEAMPIHRTLNAVILPLDYSADEQVVEKFVSSLNGEELHIPAVTLKNSRGKTLGVCVAQLEDKLHGSLPTV